MIAIPRLNLFETIEIVQHDIDFKPHSECQPTEAAPGSLDKIRVMQERLKLGQHLHHQDDHRVLATIDLQQQMADIIQVAAKEARDVARVKREASGVIDKRVVRRSFVRKKIEA